MAQGMIESLSFLGHWFKYGTCWYLLPSNTLVAYVK